MKKSREVISAMLTALVMCTSVTSCADTGGPNRPRNQLDSCPPGLILICESRQPPSKGGAEEEIPQYEYCRCEPDLRTDNKSLRQALPPQYWGNK